MLSALKDADNFVICTHINPDGDAVGSMLALGRMLRRMGKHAVMVLADPVPDTLSWLPDSDMILSLSEAGCQRYDASVCVDVTEPARMGKAFSLYASAEVRFAIDHHPGTAPDAAFAVIDHEAAAAGELILTLWEDMGIKLDREAAAQLYAAISTDTGNFSFSNVRARTFGCMEKIMQTGLDISQLSRRLFLIKSRASAAARARALASLRFFAEGKATCMHLTADDKRQTGARDGDLHGMVNEGLYIDGVVMTFMADETPAGWKISLRALPGWDVSAIARRFGGGGHVLAAGCVIPGTYEEAENMLTAAMEESLSC